MRNVNRPRDPYTGPCCIRHIEGGTVGRLLRACMADAKANPDWYPTGRLEQVETPQGTKYRQKIVKRGEAHEETRPGS